MEEVEKENELWTKIRSFFLAHPELIYKGVPTVFVLYLTLPILWTIWLYLPWLWAGYEIYHRVPAGTASTLWSAIQLYLSQGEKIPLK